MAKTITKQSRASDKPKSSGAMREIIQKKAYELFEKRGRAHGNDWKDWLEAERIIKSGRF
jgi:hypothetical protein